MILLIAGVSSGLGKAFAEGALSAGHRVIGTVRSADAATAVEALAPGRAHAMLLDVTDFDAIPTKVGAAEHQFGPIDVLVNNAGYGHEGILEESTLDDMRRQFDVNVFGAVAMIKAVLPTMRARRSGHIINVTSMDPVRAARQTKSGNQPGDPAKAAQALLKLVADGNPPSRLFLGTDALEFVDDKIAQIQAEIAAWADVSRSTNF